MSGQREMLDEIERFRTQLHQLVDTQLGALVLRTTAGNLTAHLKNTSAHVLPLGSTAARCKGVKPVAVLYCGPKQEPAMTTPEQNNGPAPPTGLMM